MANINTMPLFVLLISAVAGCGIQEQDKQAQEAVQQAFAQRCAGAAPLAMGMTPAQVVASTWGSPTSRNSNLGDTSETWRYDHGPLCGGGTSGVIDFRNGVVVNANLSH